MTPNEKQLWYRLESFELDEKNTKLTFSQRLARENGWNKNYTDRVIEEYKKFIFLCCISPTQVTPSDPVDQAWHLHLTYTKSYWINFCKNTLGKEIHHNPTKGGESEQQKFNSFYTGLQEIYNEKFGTAPPPDIWHDNKTRFNDINFQRVNLSRYWLIKKPGKATKSLIGQIIILALSLLCIQSTGTFFLIVFGIFLIIAVLNQNKNGGGNSGSGGSGNGCSSFWGSCSSDSGGDSGCSSHGGDSGCGGGGCGGGCGGD